MRWLSLLIITTALTADAADPSSRNVSRLKLRPTACVRGDTVTLADVLIFAHADPQFCEALGHRPITTALPAPATTTVTHEQVEQQIEQAGVNLALVLIGGAAACRVTLEPPDPPAANDANNDSATLLRAAPAGAPTAGQSLAQVLRQYVNDELAALDATAEIEFERASQPFLDLTTPPWEFSIRPRGHEKLGLREFRVSLRRDGQTHRTVTVFARVSASKRVLVTRQPLSVGSFVRPDALAFEPRVFMREQDVGLDRLEQVVGHQVGRFIPAGRMIRRDALKSVDMVRRSRPVTIIGAARNVHIRATGVALDSGGYGDSIRVRLEGSRKNQRVLRGVVTGPGTVRVEEDRS